MLIKNVISMRALRSVGGVKKKKFKTLFSAISSKSITGVMSLLRDNRENSPNVIDEVTGLTPLQAALKQLRANRQPVLWKIIDLLVMEGADLSTKNNEGNTPLHLICACHRKYYSDQCNSKVYSDVIVHMIKMGADVDCVNNAGKSPLECLSNTCYRKISKECSRDINWNRRKGVIILANALGEPHRVLQNSDLVRAIVTMM